MDMTSLIISIISAAASAGAVAVALVALRATHLEGRQKREAIAWVIARFNAMNTGTDPTSTGGILNEGNLIAWNDIDERQRELAMTAVIMGLLTVSTFGGAGVLFQLPSELKTA